MQARLVLSLPQGFITATSLRVEDLASHRSPGSGKYFEGRSVLVELKLADNKPAFRFLDEGGWRDANADAAQALDATLTQGKRTKTALSNNAFSCTPVSAWDRVFLSKTGGELLELAPPVVDARFQEAQYRLGMTPDEISRAVGLTPPASRRPRLYMILGPIEFLVLSNLTPQEYVWYATHRPGKKFRQVVFTELQPEPMGVNLAAETILETARRELLQNAGKKTKTVVIGDVLNKVPFSAWIGYDREAPGGLYVGDSAGSSLWKFPEKIPRAWERAY